MKARFDAMGICLLESIHSTHFLMEWTSNPFHKVLIPLRGRGRISLRSGLENAVPLHPGVATFVPENSIHRISDERGNPLTLYVLCVSAEFPLTLRNSHPNRILLCRNPVALRQILRDVREIAALGRNSPWLRCGLVAAVIGRLLAHGEAAAEPPASMSPRERVAQLANDLESEYFRATGIDDAARSVGLSRRRFTSLFSEIAGTSYATRLRALRIARAKHLLLHGHRSPTTASFECGFEDLSTFYRAFKRSEGCSPLQWIARPHPPGSPVPR